MFVFIKHYDLKKAKKLSQVIEVRRHIHHYLAFTGNELTVYK